MNRPMILGRNDGCNECDDLGYICDECVDEWLGDEDFAPVYGTYEVMEDE